MKTQAEIIPFPRPYRHPLPSDAIPRGKSRHVWVYPHCGAWAYFEVDEGGGGGAENLTKEEAVREALSYVFECAATMDVSNVDPDYRDPDDDRGLGW